VAGITREYDFVTGAETPIQPTAGTPSASSDTISLGYLQANSARSVASISALKAIGSSGRTNYLVIFVASLEAFFYFDSSSSGTSDDVFIVTPTDILSGSGRWVRLKNKPLSFGTPSSPRSVVPANGIIAADQHMNPNAQHQLIYCQSSVAGVSDISANPQIQAGTYLGQTMTTKGASTTNTLRFNPGNGLDIDGPFLLAAGTSVHWTWNGTNWEFDYGRS
jgi:hypothetical protein